MPGYVRMHMLFVRRDDVDGVERSALTLGQSIAAVPLLGLLLNWSPWGIRQAPMAVAPSVLVLAFAALAVAPRPPEPYTEFYVLGSSSIEDRGRAPGGGRCGGAIALTVDDAADHRGTRTERPA